MKTTFSGERQNGPGFKIALLPEFQRFELSSGNRETKLFVYTMKVLRIE